MEDELRGNKEEHFRNAFMDSKQKNSRYLYGRYLKWMGGLLDNYEQHKLRFSINTPCFRSFRPPSVYTQKRPYTEKE